METRFGSLTILKYYVGGAVRCLCDCGKEVVVERLQIHSGKMKDCGCGVSFAQEDSPSQVGDRTIEDHKEVTGRPDLSLLSSIKWDEQEIRQKIASNQPNSHGFIYVLTNRAMPGIVKIGKTTLLPEKRAAELSTSTGVPLPYQVYYAVKVHDCHKTEKLIHDMLVLVRDNLSREFFAISPEDAKALIEEIVNSL